MDEDDDEPMPRFSIRVGRMQPRRVLQHDDMDDTLRNLLWNALCRHRQLDEMVDLVACVWEDVLGRRTDELGERGGSFRWDQFRALFYECEWNIAYDIVELVGRYGVTIRDLEAALEKGGSAYRFVGKHLVAMVDEAQIAEIEKAQAQPLQTVRAHLDRALALIGDRKEPDYRNSIKESISAVESVAKLITGKPKVDLADALKKLADAGVNLHGGLRSGLNALYGWTSDASGIRHALKDDITPGIDEARFMLVACSAFVNFLVAKASEAGIALS